MPKAPEIADDQTMYKRMDIKSVLVEWNPTVHPKTKKDKVFVEWAKDKGGIAKSEDWQNLERDYLNLAKLAKQKEVAAE